MKDIDLSIYKNMYKSGGNIPQNSQGFCCFHLFPEGDYIFNQKDSLPDSFVIEKIKQGTMGACSSEIIKSLKEKYVGSNALVVIDHEMKEALFFMGKSKEVVAESLIKAQDAYKEYDSYRQNEFIKKYMSEYTPLAFLHREDESKNSEFVLNVSRDAGRFTPLKTYGLDRMLKYKQLSYDDLTYIIAHHELGHSLDNNFKKRSELTPDERALYNNSAESFADVYAGICSVKNRGDTKAVELWADYRACNSSRDLAFNSLTCQGKEDSYSVNNAVDFIGYNTAPALDRFVDFANEKMKKDKQFFLKISPNDMAKLAKELSDKYVPNIKKIEQTREELLSLSYGDNVGEIRARHGDILNRNGYSYTENQEMMKGIDTEIREFLKKPNSNIAERMEDKQAKKEVEKEFISNLIAEKRKGNDYPTSFLNAMATTRRDIIGNIDKLFSHFDEKKLTSLNLIVKNDKAAYKSAFAYVDFMDKVKIPAEYEGLDKKSSFAAYIETKKAYINSLKKVRDDVANGNVSDETKREFKNVLINAKYSHYLAKKAKKVDGLEDSVADMVKSDSKREYPKVLDEFFVNSKESLFAIDIKNKEALSALEIAKTKKFSRR